MNFRGCSRAAGLVALLAAFSLLALSDGAFAHGIGGKDAVFVKATHGPEIIPFVYLGAKHMVTGYDHLLFVAGVIFFLYRLSHVALYVTMFSIGHSITLLAGVLGGRLGLFVRRDEQVQAWRWVEPIIDTWDASTVPPKPYTAGTWGPAASTALMSRDGAPFSSPTSMPCKRIATFSHARPSGDGVDCISVAARVKALSKPFVPCNPTNASAVVSGYDGRSTPNASGLP